MEILDQLISFGFYSIFFLVPLVLYPFTSELFEFNKMIVVYIFTTLIVATWIGKMIISKKLIFRRTILDIPLLLFLFSQFISTVLSIDFRTSLLGYYSRFNGGLVSTICYVLLYWAFVTNMNEKKTIRSLLIIFTSSIFSCLWGVAEHFGIDKNIWVQDVQLRVFSTFGQPNWLAAWLVALISVTWALAIRGKNVIKIIPSWIFYFLNILFFAVLIFTKSRSGFLGLAVAWIIFWPIVLLRERKKAIKPFVFCHLIIIVLILFYGSPITPSIFDLGHKVSSQTTVVPTGTALETGGTESGTIRKIVWKGAIEVGLHYPIFGTGVETFAFSYYQFRPAEHNLVSEWDFLYNKAHNEYLNYFANTGTVGLLTYLAFIFFAIYQTVKLMRASPDNSKFLLYLSLVAGFVSILVTNFFGFSVVPTQVLLFLFPAFAIGMSNETGAHETNPKLTTLQKVSLTLVLFSTVYILFIISRYWYADILYAKAKAKNQAGDYLSARTDITQAIALSPNEAIYTDELAKSDSNLALILSNGKKDEDAKKLASIAVEEESFAASSSPRNLNIKRDQANLLSKIAPIDTSYYSQAASVLSDTSALAPTDPKIKLNLAIVYLHLNQLDLAEKLLQEAINLKPDYKEARFAYAAVLSDAGKKQQALDQLNYILQKIDPNDKNTADLKAEIEKK